MSVMFFYTILHSYNHHIKMNLSRKVQTLLVSLSAKYEIQIVEESWRKYAGCKRYRESPESNTQETTYYSHQCGWYKYRVRCKIHGWSTYSGPTKEGCKGRQRVTISGQSRCSWTPLKMPGIKHLTSLGWGQTSYSITAIVHPDTHTPPSPRQYLPLQQPTTRCPLMSFPGWFRPWL